MKKLRLAGNYTLMSVLTILFAAPILYMLIGSFKPSGEVLNGLAGFAPVHLSFDNYVGVFQRFNDSSTGYFRDFYLTSVIVTVTVVGVGLIINSLAAYALARLRWAGRDWVLLGVILLVVLPFEAIAIPLFYLLNGQKNSYFALIVPFIANAFAIYLFYTFFVEMPKQLEEAARIDGAGPWKTFFYVIVPSARPVFASVTILTFLVSWGSYLWPVLIINDATRRTLPLEIAVFQAAPPYDWGQIFAFGVLLVAPVLIVFLAFQRWFVQSVASSGLKG